MVAALCDAGATVHAVEIPDLDQGTLTLSGLFLLRPAAAPAGEMADPGAAP